MTRPGKKDPLGKQESNRGLRHPRRILNHWTKEEGTPLNRTALDRQQWRSFFFFSSSSSSSSSSSLSSSSSSSAIDSRAGHIFSPVDATKPAVRRGLLPSPTAWSPDQHPVAMLADVSRHIVGRTGGRSGRHLV